MFAPVASKREKSGISGSFVRVTFRYLRTFKILEPRFSLNEIGRQE